MIPAFGACHRVVPEFHGGSVQGPVCRSRSQEVRQIRLLGNDDPSQVGGFAFLKPTALALVKFRDPPANQPLSRSLRHSGHGCWRTTTSWHDQVPQVDRRVQVPVMPGPAVGQVQVRSRFSFRFTVPQALQVLLLGNHIGARITRCGATGPCRSAAA